MMLIYSEEDESVNGDRLTEVAAKHAAVMGETSRRGIFCAADPLASASTATTVRVQGDNVLLTDGPFAETKEQLAGYYILDCKDLDEAISWAAKIPTGCFGTRGCVEVRPLRELRKPASPSPST